MTATARDYAALVRATTTRACAPLVPEIALHLATDARDIWQTVEEAVDDPRAKRPFWAFAWPGGIAKARLLLDRPELVAGRRVLDIGCGSGLGAIAAMLAGARSVIANDIDPLAIAATALNAAENGVAIETTNRDLLGDLPAGIDVVLLADVVYEPELATRVAALLEVLRTRDALVLFADRGTTRLPLRPLERLYECATTPYPELEPGHIEHGIVWRL